MAEVNAKDLTTKTAPASTDSMLLFGTTTNEGAKITVDNLANNILERLTTKTFANQVGGSSAATILAQLATLNSKFMDYGRITSGDYNNFTDPGSYLVASGITNAPTSAPFYRLLVLKANNISYQIAFAVPNFTYIYFRGLNSGTWTNWVRVTASAYTPD